MKVFTFILLSVASLAASERPDGHPLYSDTVKGHDKRVVCYWGTWANYRPKDGKFTPEDIDPSLCTNLIYSFAGLDAETDSIKPLDKWMDLEEGYGLQGYRKATDLKYAYPHLKVNVHKLYVLRSKSSVIFSKVPLNFQIKFVLWYLFVLTTLHFDR